MSRRWLWLVPFTLAFAPTVAWLVSRWTDSIWRNGHGIFVPFLMAYLAHDKLKQEVDPKRESSPLGFLFLGASVVLLTLDSAIYSQLLSALALVVALPGLALLLLGARRTREIALPLALGVFMLPIPAGAIAQLLMALRLMTAWATGWIVPLFGVQLMREGTHLMIPGQLIEVADNCSGFATLYAAILTAIILAHLGRDPKRRVAVLLAAIPLAILCNFVRVSVLVLLVHQYGGQILDTQVHPASGLVLFVFVIGALVWIGGRESLRANAGSTRTPVSDRFAWATLAFCAVAFVPVAVHSYVGVKRDDCAHPEALVPKMSDVSEERAYVFGGMGAVQFREGRLPASADSPALDFVVLRSYDAKQLYYRGTSRLWGDVELGTDTPDWIESDGERLPITRSRLKETVGRHAPSSVVASLLVYEGRPVEGGWRTHLRAAPRQALLGSRPMTLFAVRADGTEAQREAAQQRVTKWLLDSWRSYRAICGE